MADFDGSVVGCGEDGPERDGALAEAGEVSDEGLLVPTSVTPKLRKNDAGRRKNKKNKKQRRDLYLSSYQQRKKLRQKILCYDTELALFWWGETYLSDFFFDVGVPQR